MASNFKRGDPVEWNSEAGRVRGTIQKMVTSEILFKGYKRHASKAASGAWHTRHAPITLCSWGRSFCY
jgi:hypothetical protein